MPIIYYRTFQFAAGPQRSDFYACPRHRANLETPPMNFLLIPGEPVREAACEPWELDDCETCREEAQ